MRCFGLFIYQDTNYYQKIRQEISNYLSMHYKEYENLQILTEEGDKDILEYINLKRLNKK